MQKTKKFLKKYWLVMWLCIVAALTITLVVRAEYIANKNRVRRVAANVANEGQQFSSNYLIIGETEIKKGSFNNGDEKGYCIVPVTIWNHSVTNTTKAYQGVLDYKLEAWLVDKTGTKISENALILGTYNNLGFSTDGDSYTNFNTYTYDSTYGYYTGEIDGSFNLTDTNGSYLVDENTYYLRFPEEMLTDNPDLYVMMVATPDKTEEFNSISAIIGIQKAGTVMTRGWTGDFSDVNSNVDYDAFNYLISGSGEADITLEWCTDYLELSQISIQRYSDDFSRNITTFYKNSAGEETATLQEGGTTWKRLSFTADSNKVDENDPDKVIGLSRYDLQFYMTGNAATDYGSGSGNFWSTVRSYVSFSAD